MMDRDEACKSNKRIWAQGIFASLNTEELVYAVNPTIF